MKKTVPEQIKELADRKRQYGSQAYYFVFEALDYTVEQVIGEKRHVSGQELLEGIRQFAIQRFGPMARMVFRLWGIDRTEDFGEIVFQLVESGLMGKTESDDRRDFANGYNLDDAFSIEKTVSQLKLN
jgi:uncharacterized repeat protein (TIGR04138 family)